MLSFFFLIYIYIISATTWGPSAGVYCIISPRIFYPAFTFYIDSTFFNWVEYKSQSTWFPSKDFKKSFWILNSYFRNVIFPIFSSHHPYCRPLSKVFLDMLIHMDCLDQLLSSKVFLRIASSVLEFISGKFMDRLPKCGVCLRFVLPKNFTMQFILRRIPVWLDIWGPLQDCCTRFSYFGVYFWADLYWTTAAWPGLPFLGYWLDYFFSFEHFSIMLLLRFFHFFTFFL